MIARLFKDVTVASVHQPTALGNQRKRSATPFNGIRKPKTDDVGMDKFASVLKVDESLGLVLGWAIVCQKDGADYYDLQGDFIPEDAMFKAASDFMQGARAAKEIHRGDPIGSVVFAFPLTADVAKAFGFETKTTGLMVAMKPSAETLKRFQSGELTGFSIGGVRVKDEEVA